MVRNALSLGFFAALAAHQTSLAAAASFVTKPEIIASVESIRAQRGSLEVGWISVVEGETALPTPKRERTWVSFEVSSRVVAESWWWGAEAPLDGAASKRYLHANDGACIVDGVASRGSAIRWDTAEWHAAYGSELWSKELFWLMRELPATGELANGHDLVALLSAEASVVRAELQAIDGANCVVVDRIGPAGVPVETLWLDPAKDWLPRLQRSYAEDGETVILERRVEAFLQVGGERWLPRTAMTLVAADSTDPVLGDAVARSFTLDEAEPPSGWTLSIGSAPRAAGLTDCTSVLPAGTVVLDRGASEPRIVQASIDYNANPPALSAEAREMAPERVRLAGVLGLVPVVGVAMIGCGLAWLGSRGWLHRRATSSGCSDGACGRRA